MAKISKMIDDITGKTEKEQQLKERFSFLQKMAEGKTEQFKSELQVMLSTKQAAGALEIVGDKAFFYNGGQHVNISNGCDDAIMEAVDSFFTGKKGVKDGFKKLVKQGLSGLIGNTSIGETTEEMFFVFPENYSIVRVDVKAYKYNFSSKGVFSNDVENVFVYAMTKSIVDHKKVGIDFLLHCVVDMMTEDGKDVDLAQVEEFVKELKAVWKMLDECDTDPNDVLKAKLADGAQAAVPAYATPAMTTSLQAGRDAFAAQPLLAGTAFEGANLSALSRTGL